MGQTLVETRILSDWLLGDKAFGIFCAFFVAHESGIKIFLGIGFDSNFDLVEERLRPRCGEDW
jgi:hypothetical protein